MSSFPYRTYVARFFVVFLLLSLPSPPLNLRFLFRFGLNSGPLFCGLKIGKVGNPLFMNMHVLNNLGLRHAETDV